MINVVLGLGSNLGDREDNLVKAIEFICLHENISYISESAMYNNKALLPEGASKEWDIDFLNMAIKIHTNLSPLDLLSYVKETEIKMGRKEDKRWAPRVIDIDILAYGDEVIISDILTIPHKELLIRNFAMAPFAEIWPEWKYPVKGKNYGKTIQGIKY